MRILHVINSLATGGAEKLLLETVPLYRQKGIEMDILVLWDDDFSFMNTLKELHCCKIFILNKSKNYKDIYNPLNVFKLRKYIKAYDIIHVHLFPAQYFVPLVNIGLNKKLIFTEHSTSNKRLKNRFFHWTDHIMYYKFNFIVCISEKILDLLSEKFNLNNRLLVIENGVNLEFVNYAPRYNRVDFKIGDSLKIIVMVAGFRIEKDQDTVIRSLALLPDNYRVLFVGDGVRKRELVELINAIGVSNKVFFLGIRSDAISIIKMSDVAVLSSHWEGFGLAAVEAMASGIPLLASDVPGLRDVVKDAGILFERGNSAELAEKILEVMDNEAYRNDIISKSLERAKGYDIQRMVDAHIELYRKVYEEI